MGPNGSGKSNLMDAISFVLGVKSAQLRSSQLRDLIYRGRKLTRGDSETAPDEDEDEGEGEGTAKRAWVMAVFIDNEDQEYHFQRTISATGGSEYRINTKIVSYQTYNETLEEHNILVKAKNFLGDVEAVASQSPKDLSRLIEQISGSLELAERYEEAKAAQDRATENATFHFAKRRGIAGEIKQFREQKSEAERFENLLAERDNLIVHQLLWRLYHIEEAMENNTRNIASKSKVLQDLRAEQAAQEESLSKARAAQANARNEVQKRERVIKKKEKALEAKRPDLVAADAQMAHSRRKVENVTKAMDATKRDVDKQQESLKKIDEELQLVRRMADEAQENTRRASQAGLSLNEEHLEEYRALKAKANVQAVAERQQLESLRRDEKTTSRTLASQRDKLDQLKDKKDKLHEDSVTQSEKLTESEAKVQELQKSLIDAKQNLENSQTERARITRLELELNEKLQKLHDQLREAAQDSNETAKETRLKETLANLQRLFPGVRGRVVDLCKPTQRKYETAVSVILGRNIDAIVVDHEKTAIECIDYLRNQRAGQATFIPLDTIKVKPINDKFRSFAKGARLAVDVIQFDSAVERAMHHACGNALVCDTMEVAKYVCYEKQQEVKAVTLEGTIIHKGGNITGGRSTHNSKKWEDQEVANMRRTQDTLIGQLRDLSQAKPRNKNDDLLTAEISRLESALAIAKDELSAVKLKVSGINEELKHIDKELKKLTPELQKTEKAYDALLRRISELEDVTFGADDELFADFCRKIKVKDIREYEQRQLKAAQQEGEARLRFDTHIARLTHQSKFETDALHGQQERLANLLATVRKEEKALSQLEKAKEAIQSELDTAEAEINSLRKAMEDVVETLDQKTAALDEVKKVASRAAKALDKTVKEIGTMNDDIEKCASERFSIYRKCKLEEIKLPLLRGSLDKVPMEENLRDPMAMDIDDDDDDDGGATQRIRQIRDYGVEVDFEDVDEEERENGSAEAAAELEAEIAKVQAEIEKMTPNLKALEKLDDVESKLAATDRETEKARKMSKEARDEFNKVKKHRADRFNKAYQHISDRIDAVYKDLTKGPNAPLGGVAYLSLEDSEEPYLSGIKYHAMPPMKRFRDMEQLSGGEKTVAALALLFAIHSYQPSPFFVLDEVDAALDNTNVAKVARYIQSQASPGFQFIVISLKCSLYEKSDSLVGVHRDQEVNSSRTLTLDLTQYD
ncbi:Structural maintenance of chromosomes protein 1 [Tulasnella sp. 403]|nr:Structural maintenance of chromosomes protein 1 [Tulasnella sp. 403]